MGIKIGNSDITLKVGSVNVDAAYLGTTLVYGGGTQTCEPTNPNVWVSLDPNEFDFSQKIYQINLEGFSDVYLYNSPNDATWAYRAYGTVTPLALEEEIYQYSIDIYDSSNQVVYNNISESSSILVVDLCEILGSGFYLKADDVPSVEVCDYEECTEYECLNWDEETGECIEQGDTCISSECMESHQEYPSVVV